MDRTDKAILNLINRSFPLEERPYKIIAERIGTAEHDVINRVEKMRKSGIIRRTGATIEKNRIGWYSTLCALDVPPDRIDEYTGVVNTYPEVTHNYIRSGHPNCWFTLITPNRSRCRQIIKDIHASLGIEILDLPANRIFKIAVGFQLY